MRDIPTTQKKPPDPEVLTISNDVWVVVYYYESGTIPMVTYHQDRNELLKMMRSWAGIDRKRGGLLYKLEAPE